MSFLFVSFNVFADGRDTSKKRTTLARLLRGLKTVNRRERVNNQTGTTTTTTTAATTTQARVSVKLQS